MPKGASYFKTARRTPHAALRIRPGVEIGSSKKAAVRASRRGRRAVFLDRDGTMANDVDYCRRPEAFRLFPGVANAIARLNRAGFVVVVVTNQSGVARRLLTVRTLQAIHQKLRRDLRRAGARVDAIYYCPHHPDDGCDCRKPRTGLLRRAAEAFKLSMADSYMIGDRGCDIDAGHAAGCQTILVRTGPRQAAANGSAPDCQVDTVPHAVRWILHRTRHPVGAAVVGPRSRAIRNAPADT